MGQTRENLRDQFGYAPDVTFVCIRRLCGLDCHATWNEALRDGLKTAAKETGHKIGISKIGLDLKGKEEGLWVQATLAH